MGYLRRLLGVFVGLGLAFTGLSASTPASAASTGISVYLGYADSLRANAVSFPTPWFGSPNTIFEGCAPDSSCTYDAGAVQVYNGSGTSAKVQSIVVTLGTCVYSGWPAAQLAPGASLIITQLKSGAVSGCVDNAPANAMDSSDVGPNGSVYTGNCTPDGLLPTVDVTIDGVTSHYVDSGQVLNTGGLDTGVCVGNESTQWTVPGSAPCHASALDLAPTSQTHPVTATATVTATFSACGQPLANARVDFSITTGPNARTTGSATTDAQGHASFTYAGTLVGTDTVGASITNPAGNINATPVLIIWTAPFAQGGAFVIGDLESHVGDSAYWWGAQWWKNNPLSTGLAPASFKGFENSNPAPTCGDTWTTRPGNSSRPPKSVPDLMLVIVSSHVTKSGPTISGDVVAIVEVKTDPGYAANPGHIGTGTIMAVLCGNPASGSITPIQHGGKVRPAAPLHPAGKSGAALAVPAAKPATPTPTASIVPAEPKKGHGKGRH